MPRNRSTYEIEVVTPFRLDLTVSVLRRFSTNIVDVFTRDGEYVRALPLPGARETMIARVKQSRADALVVQFEGGDARDHRQGLVIVRRVLGVDRDVSRFDRAARRLPWLKSLAVRMRGVKPPLLDVVNHYDSFMRLALTAQERSDLVEYLKSL